MHTHTHGIRYMSKTPICHTSYSIRVLCRASFFPNHASLDVDVRHFCFCFVIVVVKEVEVVVVVVPFGFHLNIDASPAKYNGIKSFVINTLDNLLKVR